MSSTSSTSSSSRRHSRRARSLEPRPASRRVLTLDSLDLAQLEQYSYRDLAAAWKLAGHAFIRSKAALQAAIVGAVEAATAEQPEDENEEEIRQGGRSRRPSRQSRQPVRYSNTSRVHRRSVSLEPARPHAAAAASRSPRRRSERARPGGVPSSAEWERGADPTTYPATMEHVLENGATCTDFIMFADEAMTNHVLADPLDHIILLGPSTESDVIGSNAICFSRSRLRKMLKDPDYLFYPCQGSKLLDFVPNPSVTLVKIPFANFTAFVPNLDVEIACADVQTTIFQIVLSQHHFDRTASNHFFRTQDRVSSNHCQEGTAKHIHRLRSVYFE
jgi:hypothetical protein